MSKGNKQDLAKFAGKGAVLREVDDDDEGDEEEEAVFDITSLPYGVQRRVKALKNIHKDRAALEKKHREEIAELERKYLKLYAPLYEKRSTIVTGDYEPTDDEARLEGEEQAAAPTDAKKSDEKGIPEFWLTAMKNNVHIAETITEKDEDALNYLRDIKYSEEGQHSFTITFHFAENPYFSETTLTKTYHLVEDEQYGELVFDRAEGSKISWKPSKNLTVTIKKVTKAARGGKGKKGGAAKVTTKEEPCDSFFLFFTPPDREKMEAEAAEQGEEEEDMMQEMMDNLLESDFEMGCIFKDKIVPHAIMWYTGEAQEFDDDDDYGFGDEYDDEDDDGEDDDDDDDDDEDVPPKRGGRGGKPQAKLPGPKGAGGAPGQPQQPECKQQ